MSYNDPIGRPIHPWQVDPRLRAPQPIFPPTFIEYENPRIKELERRIAELEKKLEEAGAREIKSDNPHDGGLVARRVELTEAQKKSHQTKTPASKLRKEGLK